MNATRAFDRDCLVLEKDDLQLRVARSIGPRILTLRFRQGENLFAELPDSVTERPDGKIYRFYGGHRFWLSPEDPILSYSLDDQPVELSRTDHGILVRKAIEAETGIEKSILLDLEAGEARLTLTHRLINRGPEPVEGAPWAITQFRTGGVAILPQARTQTGLLPNRAFAVWSYSDLSSPCLTIGNEFILLRASMQAPFKIGFPNPRGWMAYWLDGVLFVKRSAFDPRGNYSDFGSSSECYCNKDFLELETLAPLSRIEPGAAVTHVETWEIHPEPLPPDDEQAARAIAAEFGLE